MFQKTSINITEICKNYSENFQKKIPKNLDDYCGEF